MLTKVLKRAFSTRVFSWGYNLRNLGFNENEVAFTTLPKELNLELKQNVKKAACGYDSSLIITEKGTVYVQPGSTFNNLKANTFQLDSSLQEKEFSDGDCDAEMAILLAKDGSVVHFEKSKRIDLPQVPIKVKFVSAGSGFFLAAGVDSENHTRVFAWNLGLNRLHPVLNSKGNQKSNDPFELVQVSKIIGKKNSPIKKMKVVSTAAVVLLENGELISWGDNLTGNLGVPRSELTLFEKDIALPAEPLMLNGLNEKVVDFDLSSNILVILTASGKAYFSGLNNVLKLREIPFFPNNSITAVGATFNHFFLKSEEGNWFSNKIFEGQKMAMFFGAVELYQIPPRDIKGVSFQAISGKYENALAF